MFSDLMYRFPNMVVGALTRESCREAFKLGITAAQVKQQTNIYFLELILRLTNVYLFI